MLVLDIFHNAKGDLTVQLNPKQRETIGKLRDCLSNYTIENPLVTFSNRHSNNYYGNVPEEYVRTDAWVCETLGGFWKDSDKDKGRPSQNVLTILSRMIDVYLDEHYELLQLREKCQKRPSGRKKKSKQLPNDDTKLDNSLHNIFIADSTDFNDLDDLAMVPIDYYSFGVGLCCSKYSEYLSERMQIENDICLCCHDEGSDEGVVTYSVPVYYRQLVTVVFTNNEPFKYDVDIMVDTYGDEDLEPETLHDYLLGKDRRIRIPFTGNSVIEPKIEKIKGPVELCTGVKLSHRLRFENDAEELSATMMRNIFVTTRAMLKFINDDIMNVT